MAQVIEILIAASPTDPMAPQSNVRAVAGMGLAGDRYFTGPGTFSPQPRKPDYEVTLVQHEHLAPPQPALPSPRAKPGATW